MRQRNLTTQSMMREGSTMRDKANASENRAEQDDVSHCVPTFALSGFPPCQWDVRRIGLVTSDRSYDEPWHRGQIQRLDGGPHQGSTECG